MSESETFVARWSRLKREAGKAAEAPQPPSRPEAEVAPAIPGQTAERDAPKAEGTAEEPFDLASLPSIESIVEGTDIRAFLQSGVPAELTKAALRRAWSADPAIRDFIGLAENQWDFTDPTAIPGFGPLLASDNVGELAAQAMGKARDTAARLAEGPGAPDEAVGSVHRNTEPAEPPSSSSAIPQDLGRPEENPLPAAPAEQAGGQQNRVDVAARDESPPEIRGRVPNRRGHGSALPQ
jgi:hypothetical protein